MLARQIRKLPVSTRDTGSFILRNRDISGDLEFGLEILDQGGQGMGHSGTDRFDLGLGHLDTVDTDRSDTDQSDLGDTDHFG